MKLIVVLMKKINKRKYSGKLRLIWDIIDDVFWISIFFEYGRNFYFVRDI